MDFLFLINGGLPAATAQEFLQRLKSQGHLTDATIVKNAFGLYAVGVSNRVAAGYFERFLHRMRVDYETFRPDEMPRLMERLDPGGRDDVLRRTLADVLLQPGS